MCNVASILRETNIVWEGHHQRGIQPDQRHSGHHDSLTTSQTSMIISIIIPKIWCTTSSGLTFQRLVHIFNHWRRPEFFEWDMSCFWAIGIVTEFSVRLRRAITLAFSRNFANLPFRGISLTCLFFLDLGEIVVVQREATDQLREALEACYAKKDLRNELFRRFCVDPCVF